MFAGAYFLSFFLVFMLLFPPRPERETVPWGIWRSDHEEIQSRVATWVRKRYDNRAGKELF